MGLLDILKKEKPDMPEDKNLMEFSIAFIVKKDYKKALELLDKVKTIKGESYWYTKGNILANLHELEEALKCYDKALKLDPKFVKAWYRKGWALISLKEGDKAIDCFEKVISIEGWLQNAFKRGKSSNDFNLTINTVIERVKGSNWSQAALISQTYVLMVDANSKHGKISNLRRKKINENLVLAYLVLRAYPKIAPYLPNLTSPEFLNKNMPDFIFQNFQNILNIIEPPIVVEFRIAKS